MTGSGDGILCGGICMVFIIFQVKGFLNGSNKIRQMNLKGGAFNFAIKEGGFFLLSRQVPPPRSWLLIRILYIAWTLLMTFQKCSHFEMSHVKWHLRGIHININLLLVYTTITEKGLTEKFQRPSCRYLKINLECHWFLPIRLQTFLG